MLNVPSQPLLADPAQSPSAHQPTPTSPLVWRNIYLLYWLLLSPLLRPLYDQAFIPSGYIDVDFLVAGVVALFLPAVAAPVLACGCVALEIIDGFMRTYYFAPHDLPDAFRSIASLPASRITSWAAAFIALFLSLAISSYLLRRAVSSAPRLRGAAFLLSVAVAISLVDGIWGGHRLINSPDAISVHRLTRLPESSIYKEWRFAHALVPSLTNASHSVRGIDSAAAHGLTLLASFSPGATRPNMVEAVVESWGTDKTGVLDRRFLSLYNTPALRSRYRVIVGTVPFVGPTVYGETRELCENTLGFGILHAAPTALTGCLPWQLDREGYRTVGIHGYQGRMFDRYRWYPLVGFSSTWFADDLRRRAGLSRCAGIFPGICDAQIAAWIGDQLVGNRSGHPLFLYWMTLNSHLPVPSGTASLNPVPCSFDPQLAASVPLCAWFKLEYQVHQSLAETASRPGLPNTAFFIVGDHAPPFNQPALRGRFSPSAVPFILLIPRQTPSPGNSRLILAHARR